MDLPSPSSEILIRADFPVLDIGIFDPQRGGAKVTAGYDILFEQKFVCSLERSSRTVCNFSEQQPRPCFDRLPAADRISALPLEEPDGSQN